MTAGDFLQQGTSQLTAAGIDSPRLDCLLLLEDILGIDRARLLAHPEIVLGEQQQKTLINQCRQRATHTPLAYIRGKASFYGRDFLVSTATLVPRPETEDMVHMAIDIPDLPPIAHFADIGTGTGCIGISVALERPGSAVTLYDISPSALAIARKNAQVLGAKVTIVTQDLLSVNKSMPYFDVLLANLPYVPDHYPINTAATFEPKLALFSGADGLDLYRRLWQQITDLPEQPLYVLTESLAQQHNALAGIASQAGYTQAVKRGLIQQFVR